MPQPETEALATARQAILFRQHFPPRHDVSTLSFFGGLPIAPRGFRWPRSTGPAQSKPFSFLMQIDCAAVPEAARLDMLPDRGVLYFFQDLTWGEPNALRVLYEEGVARDWAPVPPPDDLGPAFGSSTFGWEWPRSVEDCPKLLPKWTFEPVAIELPLRAYDPDEPDAAFLWPGEKTTAEILRAAQGQDVVSNPFSVQNLIDAQGALLRPFDNYPHDWRAIQICCGLLIGKLQHRRSVPGIAALRGVSELERDALVAQIADDAQRWFAHARSNAPFAAVPQEERDRFWSWLADKVWIVRFVIGTALTMSIEASLCESPEAAARIPPNVAARLHSRHALAVRTEQGLFATTPDRMLAPPVDVQGNQWERAKTHLLLLEMSSNTGLGHHFAEGVYQFWITAEDLKARRFDKVELTADAY